ncbi:MAG: Cytidylate kinase [Holosporales bacterium]
MIIIAIDGPAGAGKGTVARSLSEKLKYAVIETGLFYRALAFSVIKIGGAYDDETAINACMKTLTLDDLENPHLRDEAVASVASILSKQSFVRKKITQQIRDVTLSLKANGVVLDGRDVGTHIFKDADLKFFITADPIVRANRRLKEMQEKKLSPLLDNYLQAIIERDHNDTTRAHSPLEKAPDAIEVDTTDMTPDAVCAAVFEIVSERLFHD